MALARKKLLLGGGVSLAAVGGVGAWMLMGNSNGEQRRHDSSPVRQRRSSSVVEPVKAKGDATQTIVMKEKQELKEPQEDPPKQNVEEQQPPKKPEEPEEERGEPGRVEQRVLDDEGVDGREQFTEQMKGVGFDCGDATVEKYCTTGSGGSINVDIDGVRKDDYVFSKGNNGNIKLRISNDSIGKKFSFDITKKSIKLESKSNPNDTITLEKYEKYGLEKDDSTGKVYLTRKLNSIQGMIEDLGLPSKCDEKITSDPFDYKTTKDNPTCELKKYLNQIQSVNFEGKREEGATSKGNLNIYIQKVSDTTTYKDGYRFYIQGFKEIDISDKDKLAPDVWWDFRLKEGEGDKLLLERVWKKDTDLLKKVGLSCGVDGKCSINNSSLKIKIDGKVIEKGRRKSGEGNIYLEKKNMPGHYEGLRFSVWGGGMEMEGSGSSPIKMEEAEIYHITKEDSPGSSYYLTRKHGVEEMIKVHLGLNSGCPPVVNSTISCSGNQAHLKKFKFHDGEGVKMVGDDVESLSLNVVIAANQNKTTYPLGYKFSLQSSKDVNIGKISLAARTNTDFKIRRDIKNKKLYLERAV